MSLYDETLPTFLLTLQNLDGWLQKAIDSADSRGFDAEKLLAGRLAPDQFDLTRQIQSTCDTAKLCGARLAGVDAPKHEDGPATMAELRVRIAEVRAFLSGLSRDDIDGGGDRVLSPGFLRGGSMSAANLAREFSMPNFYFHVVMAYAILRHQGVPLGKMDFLGRLTIIPAAPPA